MASVAFWRLYRSGPARDTNLEALALPDWSPGWHSITYVRNGGGSDYEARSRTEPIGLAPGPDESFERSEERERVRAVLGKLKREQAGLILLYHGRLRLRRDRLGSELKTTSVGNVAAVRKRSERSTLMMRKTRIWRGSKTDGLAWRRSAD